MAGKNQIKNILEKLNNVLAFLVIVWYNKEIEKSGLCFKKSDNNKKYRKKEQWKNETLLH
jgi:hypothetical protein